MWAAVREALPLWVIWSLGACDMGPRLHYYIILTLEIFVVIVSSPTLKSYSTNFPQLLLCYALSFLQKICSTQSVKVIRYVSLYLCAFPYLRIHYFFIPSLLSHGVYYLCFLIRTWQRINMVRNLARQVKFELDQADWVLGILTRRLCNIDT